MGQIRGFFQIIFSTFCLGSVSSDSISLELSHLESIWPALTLGPNLTSIHHQHDRRQDYSILTLQKFAIWMSKNCQKLLWKKMKFFFKWQVFGNFFYIQMAFSRRVRFHITYHLYQLFLYRRQSWILSMCMDSPC